MKASDVQGYIIHIYIYTHYITLHYITLHYITLHCITLHYIALHCIALHCIALHYITLHYITLHYITYIHTYIHTYIYIYIYTHTHTRDPDSWDLHVMSACDYLNGSHSLPESRELAGAFCNKEKWSYPKSIPVVLSHCWARSDCSLECTTMGPINYSSKGAKVIPESSTTHKRAAM